jgi:hypothetical protein
VRHQETEGNMSTGTSHQKDPEKARPAGIFSRRDMLLTGTYRDLGLIAAIVVFFTDWNVRPARPRYFTRLGKASRAA